MKITAKCTFRGCPAKFTASPAKGKALETARALAAEFARVHPVGETDEHKVVITEKT